MRNERSPISLSLREVTLNKEVVYVTQSISEELARRIDVRTWVDDMTHLVVYQFRTFIAAEEVDKPVEITYPATWKDGLKERLQEIFKGIEMWTGWPMTTIFKPTYIKRVVTAKVFYPQVSLPDHAHRVKLVAHEPLIY